MREEALAREGEKRRISVGNGGTRSIFVGNPRSSPRSSQEVVGRWWQGVGEVVAWC